MTNQIISTDVFFNAVYDLDCLPQRVMHYTGVHRIYHTRKRYRMYTRAHAHTLFNFASRIVTVVSDEDRGQEGVRELTIFWVRHYYSAEIIRRYEHRRSCGLGPINTRVQNANSTNVCTIYLYIQPRQYQYISVTETCEKWKDE